MRDRAAVPWREDTGKPDRYGGSGVSDEVASTVQRPHRREWHRRLGLVAIAVVGVLGLGMLDGDQEIMARRRDYPPPVAEKRIPKQRSANGSTPPDEPQQGSGLWIVMSMEWSLAARRAGEPVFQPVFTSWPPG